MFSRQFVSDLRFLFNPDRTFWYLSRSRVFDGVGMLRGKVYISEQKKDVLSRRTNVVVALKIQQYLSTTRLPMALTKPATFDTFSSYKIRPISRDGILPSAVHHNYPALSKPTGGTKDIHSKIPIQQSRCASGSSTSTRSAIIRKNSWSSKHALLPMASPATIPSSFTAPWSPHHPFALDVSGKKRP